MPALPYQVYQQMETTVQIEQMPRGRGPSRERSILEVIPKAYTAKPVSRGQPEKPDIVPDEEYYGSLSQEEGTSMDALQVARPPSASSSTSSMVMSSLFKIYTRDACKLTYKTLGIVFLICTTLVVVSLVRMVIFEGQSHFFQIPKQVKGVLGTDIERSANISSLSESK